MKEESFAKRLAELRIAKNVSAREMSLSIGQSVNYINSIENRKSLPSMRNFFYICEYLGITPAEFFNIGRSKLDIENDLLLLSRRLNSKQLDAFINFIKLLDCTFIIDN